MKKLLDSPKIYLLFTIPISIGFFFIWWKLALRPLHHDESLNAIYGLYFYFDQANQYYKYDPMLHGPLLYHLLPWIYHFLGESYQAIRAIPALAFTLIPLFFFPFLKNIMNWKAVIAIALLVTGPSYIYWGKFLRHDQLVLLTFSVIALGFLPRFNKYFSYFFIIPIALQFCIKENAYVNSALLLGFLIFEYLVGKRDLYLLKKLTSNKKHLVISLLIGVFLYVYYYSAGFQYAAGPLDGLYRKSLSYWLNQHEVERIAGPFLTQFFTLLWYELSLVSFLFFAIFKLHWNQKTILKLLPILALIFSGFFHFIYGPTIPASSLWSTLGKLKIGIDFYGFFFLMATSISGTWILLKDDKRTCAFLYYATFASFFTYSFLGEKVPWLSLYILLPGILFLAVYFKDISNKILIPTTAIAICFNLFQAYRLNFINAGAKTEFISQVHTSKDYESLAFKLQDRLERGAPLKILAYRNNTWPLSWYLYKREGYHYHRKGRDLDQFAIILDSHPTETIMKDYNKKIIPLRHWWVPDWKKMNLVNTLKYSLTHEPWNSPGSQKITIFSKKELTNF